VSLDGRPFAGRAEVVAYKNMMLDFQIWTRAAFEEFGVPSEQESAERVFRPVWARASEKYGDWDGYDQMSLPLILQHFSATYLGF
jgi:hypothetical protein